MEIALDSNTSNNTSLTTSFKTVVSAVRISGGDVGCVGDGMVNIEIEAAEALAGLAHSSAWRVHEEEEEEELLRGSSKEGDVSLSPLMGSGKDASPLSVEQHYRDVDNSREITENGGRDVNLHKSSLLPPTIISPHLSVGKSRQHLNEAEKEARRLHRVLANRESARQTILRRQAHSEELRKKAASLAWENDDLKKEKEQVNQEYDDLKNINESLKVQIGRRDTVEETNVEPKSTPPKTSTSRSACPPPFLYNQQPFFWSPLIQLPNGSQNGISVGPTLPTYNVSSEQENNGPGVALCVYPCAWFMPPTDHGDHLHIWPFNNPSSTNGPNTSPSTKTIENHNHQPSMRLDTETCRKMASEGGQKSIEFGTEEVVPIPSLLTSFVKGVVAGKRKASHCSTSKTIHSFLGKEKPTSYVVINKKRISDAAAEARRKRKEVTRLKRV
ncbi:uncharacterized protein LOC124935156 [Impatiens glandulifera]|uniref:uncharacterized protein LOC124935156 n=1 Tax=Impatiens glandulifera TaxID=253017 RepID=UPI001FB0E3FA|nr:uncharacterized protein LOC124935156 [Impatiens glandulifera]